MINYLNKPNITLTLHVIKSAAYCQDDDLLKQFADETIDGESLPAKNGTLMHWLIKSLKKSNDSNDSNGDLISSLNKQLIPKESFKQLMIFTQSCISKASLNALRHIHKLLGTRLEKMISRFIKGRSYDDLVKIMMSLLKHYKS